MLRQRNPHLAEPLEDVLLNLAQLGSFDIHKAAFYLSCDETDVLAEQAWLERWHEDFYVLTQKTASFVQPALRYRICAKLAQYSSAVADEAKLSVLELIQRLAASGWQEESCARSINKQPPVTRNGPWVWYSKPMKAPSRCYLQVLLAAGAGQILDRCPEIHHGQLEKFPARI